MKEEQTIISKVAFSTLPLSSASLSSFSFGYNIGAPNKPALLFNSCLPLINDKWDCFYVSLSDWGVMSSMMCVGALIGSLGAGHLSAFHGRLKSIKMTSIVYIIGLLLFAFAMDYWMLFVGRIIIGMGVGVSCVVVPMYLTECSAVEERGWVVFFHQMGIVMGIVAIEALGLIIGVEGGRWRWLIILNALLMASQLFMLSWCEESPKYNVSSARRDSQVGSKSVAQAGGKEESATCNVFAFCSTNQWNQWNLFLLGCPVWRQQVHSLWVALLNLVMTIVSMAIVERGGRRVLLLGSLAGMTVAAFMLCLVQSTQLMAISILLFVATFAIGLGPIPWIVMSELFPTSTASLFLPLAVSTNWICNMLVVAIFLPLKNALGERGLFACMGIICASLLAISWMFMVETKGRPAGYIS